MLPTNGYVLLSAFLFVAQLLLYAGGIMVLFLFIITLLGADMEDIRGRWFGERGIAVGLGIAALLIVGAAVLQATLPAQAPGVASDPGSIGNALFSGYLFPVEIISVLLLAATVGAVMLSRRDR